MRHASLREITIPDIACAIKRKSLQMYIWKNRIFMSAMQEICKSTRILTCKHVKYEQYSCYGEINLHFNNK
jgi:hypothetical protein